MCDHALTQQLEQCACCEYCSPIPCHGVTRNGQCLYRCVCHDDADARAMLDFNSDNAGNCFPRPDGSCSAADSDYCNFACPYRDR